eukprot:2429225-Pyramimonas_sp.AAC.1
MQELHGWRAAPFQNVALGSAPRTFGSDSNISMANVSETVCWHDVGLSRRNSYSDSRCEVPVLCSGHDSGSCRRNSSGDSRVGVPGIVLLGSSVVSNDCPPTGHFLQ